MGPSMAMRNIIVVPYNPEWVTQYEVEAAEIQRIFGDELAGIHHIGSTSIPGLVAKPVIDMMPVVHDIERVKLYIPHMEALGYVYRGENDIPGRQYFSKGPNEHRTHHVHIYQPDHPEVARHLDFRDYLRAHPDEAQRYGNLKASLAPQFHNDIYGYMDGKNEFIQTTIAKAQAWRKRSEVGGEKSEGTETEVDSVY